MLSQSVIRSAVAASFLLFGSRAVNAACVINGVRPTVALPTMAAGQQFSFIATADCEKLRFRVPGTTLTKIPKAGPDRGSKDRTYKVVLTEREWKSVVDEGDTTFTWSIIGTTSAGVTTRVTTTNEVVREPVTLSLSLADAKLVGEEVEDVAGWSVSGAGDVDGDHRDDLLVGAYGNDEGGADAGAAYLVLGPVTGTVDLSLADAKLVGEAAGDYAGMSVSDAGDVNGDGHPDLLVGATGNAEGGDYAGAAYLVLGPVTGTLNLSLAHSQLVGETAGDLAGNTVSDAGDVDDDGYLDVLVGAYGNDAGGSDAGAAYLVLGPITGTLDLSVASAKFVGEGAGDQAGSSVASAGDIDGDGHDDMLVGAPYNAGGSSRAGAAYLVLGPVTGTLDLSVADAKRVGDWPFDYAGVSVSGAGDTNADGHDDILVTATGDDEGGTYAGAAYLVLGPVTGTNSLSRADAKLVGEEAYDLAGVSASGAGDVDGDGDADLLVSANWSDEGGPDAGGAYLVLGPVTGTVDLSLADVKLVGPRGGFTAGICVSGAGDVDSDGHDDLLIGSGSPGAYLVYGGGLF